MLKIFTSLVTLACLLFQNFSFAQDTKPATDGKPTKDETIKYIYSKFKNSEGYTWSVIRSKTDDPGTVNEHHSTHTYDLYIKSVLLDNNNLIINTEDNKPNSFYFQPIITINLDKVTNYKIQKFTDSDEETGNHGYNWSESSTANVIYIYMNSQEIYCGINWDSEPNLENKLKNAFNRLIELNGGAAGGGNDPFNK